MRSAGMTRTRRPAPHPGIALLDWLRPFDISQNALARRLGVPARRINEIVLGKRSITAETAVLLEEALGFDAEAWMRLQAAYDISRARQRLRSRPRPDPLQPWSPEPPRPDPLEELLDDYPIVKLGLERAKAVKGELWRTRRRKARVRAERERIYWLQKDSLDAARKSEREFRALQRARKAGRDAGDSGGTGSSGEDTR